MMKKVAVLLFNLGGPLESKDVKPFLYNLFKDKYIISLPFGLRHFVARMISTTREKPAQANYNFMGGGSPILAQTQAQANALAAYAEKTIKGAEVKTFIGMRYWHPFVEDTVKDIDAWGPDEIVLLPLYPQFSKTTTLSSLSAFKKAYKGRAKVTAVCCYPENDFFIKAQVDLIRAAIKDIKNPDGYRILFSAHGLPEKVIQEGDPYQAQVEATVAKVMAELKTDIDHVICYQSRVGPLKWIGPATDETITQTGQSGKNIVLVPIAFVSEHIETLVELDIEYKHLADVAGVSSYIRVPAVGTNPDYIRALGDQILKALATTEAVISDHACATCHSHCPKLKAA
ncbi:ferrochelatase [Asticcacaulis machinosus]|uniref:ferrochelatase n=1 Tax=Asticcacaulis machinosus TaxID=2984211 RepID=UPI003F642024